LGKQPLVLVIEDSPSAMELTVKTLEISGFRTRRATSAFEAIGLARKERPDIILADVGLPDMDGATATSLLRDDPEFQDVPVILISALPAEELRERMAESGAVDILPKPFTPGDLTRCLRRHLSREA
jgi:CheY-like chemotaxis protein